MTALLDLIKARADRPEPLPQPLAFIAHPAWTEDASMPVVLRGVATPAGVPVGRLNFCLCPNGLAKRAVGGAPTL